MTPVWTESEQRLITGLAVGMGRMLSDLPASGIGQRGYVWDMACSEFESGCFALWNLGVALTATKDRKNISRDVASKLGIPAGSFKFLPEGDIRRILSRGPNTRSPLTEEIIEAYLDAAHSLGSLAPSRSTTRDSSSRYLGCGDVFQPHPVYEHEFGALIDTGYMEQCEGGVVCWSEKITPHMCNCYLWQRPSSYMDFEAVEALSKEALSLVPEEKRNRLHELASKHQERDFILILKQQFGGLFITHDPDGTPRPWPGDLRLARLVRYQLRG